MSKSLLTLNAFNKTINYKGISKTINDDYWEREIAPIITPIWDTPKDRLELFVYKEDKTYLVQRNKYVRNFKTKDGKWVSYEFDPAAITDFVPVEDLFNSVSEKFIQYKETGEAEYEKALQQKFRADATLNWDKVKLVRKFLLDESDWTQVEDAPVTAEEKVLYQKYRTYLRELFNQNQVELPYDVCFPITPKEYLHRKTLDIPTVNVEALGTQGVDEEYLFSEYHFWKLTSPAVNSFAQKMAIYVTMKSILDEDAKLSGVRPVRKFRDQTINLMTETEMRSDSVDAVKVSHPAADPEAYIKSLITRIENGEI
jgi:hypothetical protein